MKQQRGKKRYFTLIELLVTMGLIIVISMAAMPAYSSLMRGRKLDSATYAIHAAVMDARTHAISSKNYSALLFYPTADSKDDGVCYRVAEVYYDNETDKYAFKRWANESEDHFLPEGVKIPFSSNADFGLAEKSTDTKGTGSLRTITMPTSTRFSTEIRNYITKAKPVIFKPNGQLAGTDEKFVVIRLTESKRYDASKNDAPRIPININWLTGMAVTQEAVNP